MARSLLFVPGNRPDRFEKACDTAADLVCIDLEDAVAPQDKESARETVFSYLAGTSHRHVALRINAADTEFYEADLKGLAGADLELPFVMVPKVSHVEEIAAIDKVIPERSGSIFALIESAKGLINCEQIMAHQRVKYALYGAIDYAGDVGCSMDWETHLYARSRMVAACAAYDVTLFDTPYTDVRDADGLMASTRQGRQLGIFARSAIHPAQIGPIHEALAPSEAEVSHARRVVEAYDAASGNVALLDGKMIEAPILKAARRILSWID